MATVQETAPVLVLGPVLRYVGETAVSVWLETDKACDVEVLGRHARTFEVAGHHYAPAAAAGRGGWRSARAGRPNCPFRTGRTRAGCCPSSRRS